MRTLLRRHGRPSLKLNSRQFSFEETSSFLRRDFQVQIPDEAMQIVGMYTEKLCGFGVIAACPLEGAADKLPLCLHNNPMVFGYFSA